MKIKIPSYSKTNAENDQIELAKVLEQKKILEAREQELKNRLGGYMEKSFKPDGKGHFLMTVLDSDGRPRHLMRQARKKITLNHERAIEYLRNNKLTNAILEVSKVAKEITEDQLIEVLEKHGEQWMLEETEIADEALLAQLVSNGTIEMSDFEQLCDKDVSYAMVFLSEDKFKEYEKERGANATSGEGEAVQASERKSNNAVSNRKTRK